MSEKSLWEHLGEHLLLIGGTLLLCAVAAPFRYYIHSPKPTPLGLSLEDEIQSTKACISGHFTEFTHNPLPEIFLAKQQLVKHLFETLAGQGCPELPSEVLRKRDLWTQSEWDGFRKNIAALDSNSPQSQHKTAMFLESSKSGESLFELPKKPLSPAEVSDLLQKLPQTALVP